MICDAEFCAVLMAAITCLTAVLFNVLSRISRFLCREFSLELYMILKKLVPASRENGFEGFSGS